MVQVPTYTTQFSRNVSGFNGLGKQNISANAGSFGANEARNLSQAGNAIAKLSAQTADIQNKARLLDAKNQYETLSRQIESEYGKLQSGDALGVQEKYIADLEEQRKSIADQLDNGYQREAFSNIADRNDMSTKFNMQRHEYVQSIRYKNDNNKSALMNINTNMQKKINGENYGVMVDGAIFEAQQYLYSDGDSDEVKEQKLNSYLDNMHQQNLNVLMAQDPKSAKAYYEKYNKEINPNSSLDWKKATTLAEERQSIVELSLLNEDADPTELRKQMSEKGYSDKVIKGTVSGVKTIQAEKKSAEKAKVDNMVKSDIELLKLDPNAQIPVRKEYGATELAQIDSARKTIKEFGKIMDDPAYVETVKTMMSTSQTEFLNRWKNKDFNFSKMSDKTQNEFEGKYKDILNGKEIPEEVALRSLEELIPSLEAQVNTIFPDDIINKNLNAYQESNSVLKKTIKNEIFYGLENMPKEDKNDPRAIKALVGDIARRHFTEAGYRPDGLSKKAVYKDGYWRVPGSPMMSLPITGETVRILDSVRASEERARRNEVKKAEGQREAESMLSTIEITE